MSQNRIMWRIVQYWKGMRRNNNYSSNDIDPKMQTKRSEIKILFHVIKIEGDDVIYQKYKINR